MTERVVVLGSTGAVGACAVTHLLASDNVSRVTTLVRRQSTITHDKLISTVADMKRLGLSIPDDVTCGVCAIGTTIKQAGSKEAFVAVDRDLVVAFAKACLDRGARRFVLVSSLGANARSWNFYLRTKGEAEDLAASVDFETVYVLRPSVLDDEGGRSAAGKGRPMEAAAIAVMKGATLVLGRQHKYAPISVDAVGWAIAHLVTSGQRSPRVQRLESDALHGIVRSARS